MTSPRSLRLAAAAMTAAVALAVAPAALAQWKPTKPINVIVPWAAGGATDQMIRATAAELEPALGQKIIVVNQPGASGSIGTKNALEAPKDGYTWTSGAPKDLGSYKILGMLDTTVQDWNLYLNLALPTIISVPANSPYKTAAELIAAMKAKPGAISVATAGVNSSGHTAMDQVAAAAAHHSVGRRVADRPGHVMRVRRQGSADPFPRTMTVVDSGLAPMECIEVVWEVPALATAEDA